MTTSSPRRSGPRRSLSEDQVLDAAVTLLDRGGASAASVRGIAQEVGVAPNAVYTYFPDKSAVVKALVERTFGEIDLGFLAGRRQKWQDRIERLAVALREQLTLHPGVVPLMIGGPMDGPNALALNEKVLEILADAGLDDDEAARACYLFIVYVFGSIALEVADLDEHGPPAPEADRISARTRVFEQTPAEHFPRTAAASSVMAAYVSTDQFRWGVRRLIAGLTATADAD
jgi:TetR/AcrR family tetracycline transcriptional repressor